jgi:hypothetical protein
MMMMMMMMMMMIIIIIIILVFVFVVDDFAMKFQLSRVGLRIRPAGLLPKVPTYKVH